MPAEDFAILYGKLYGVEMPNREYKWTKPEHIAYVAKLCLEKAKAAYELVGIDLKAVEKSKGKNDALKKAAVKEELLPMAKSAYVFLKLKKAGFFSIKNAEEPSSQPFETENKGGKGMGYMLKYKKFIAIKKLTEKAKKYEGGALLATCIERLIEKYMFYKEGMQKGQKALKGKLDDIVKELEVKPFEALAKKALAYKSFRPYPYLEGLIKAYPDLKPKKPRGRLPKA